MLKHLKGQFHDTVKFICCYCLKRVVIPWHHLLLQPLGDQKEPKEKVKQAKLIRKEAMQVTSLGSVWQQGQEDQ